jgi:hypothetical protein
LDSDHLGVALTGKADARIRRRALSSLFSQSSISGGSAKYLEDLVARDDAPLLDNLDMAFFHQLIFDTPHLAQFLRRTPKFKAYDEAQLKMVFSNQVTLPQTSEGRLRVNILHSESDWRLSSLT